MPEILSGLFQVKWLVVAIFIASTTYVHFRGRVRHRFFRQLTDHSTFTAPINTVMYLCSKVPATPFLREADFPRLKPVTDAWEMIRDEAVAAYREGVIKAANGFTDAGFNSFFRTGWTRFYLKWYGKPLDSARSVCPRTLALLESIPGIEAAMFTVLPPGARLPNHRDPYAGSIRYHLGLVTPNSPECYIEVDGEKRHWRDGEALFFDETYIHTAVNNTEVARIILFLDIDRPLNNPLARAFNHLVRVTLLRASATENVPGERIGLINRLFSQVYKIRVVGKNLKKRSKPAYYLAKWVLIGGLLYLVLR
ncbi:aspartyl/asparaginyl beta-hydroxylase domain-containing protein [Derxia gummosa]|uniref:Aspartyl/asparaginyl beta-hydroxylase domain-containing protein n=1 Tax=Derxia gummosa DSM 723 TaxID=1121388 RepID=A0A9U5FV84_9BURK|nr:aspartyl/asparaginyl beta-hydroxylase domain-containing protein [Derxia gummosa]